MPASPDAETATPDSATQPEATGPVLADDPDETAKPHGRIGYGRLGRFSPLVLGLVLALALAGIWWAQREQTPSGPTPSRATGQPAPDVSLTLLDGESLRLAALRGNVVVLNFWASWCAPCRQEMPELQAYWDDAQSRGEETVIVGVGVRTDNDADARAFVAAGGFTYPIGRDTDTDQPGIGPVEAAFGVPNAYPSTIVIGPDGVVDAFHLGPLSAEMLGWMIEQARE